MTDGELSAVVVTDEPASEQPRRPGRTGELVRIAAVSLVLAVTAGLTWVVVAPRPEVVGGADGAFFASDLPGQFIAADGWFAVIGLVAGVVLAVYVLVRRDVGPFAVVAVTVCGALGSLLAWRIGVLLGGGVKPGAHLDVGATGHIDLTLQAKGVLLVWPIVTLGILLFALAWQAPERDDPPAQPDAGDEVGSVARDRQVGEVDGGQ